MITELWSISNILLDSKSNKSTSIQNLTITNSNYGSTINILGVSTNNLTITNLNSGTSIANLSMEVHWIFLIVVPGITYPVIKR